jgi:anti-anti-sigma factor
MTCGWVMEIKQRREGDAAVLALSGVLHCGNGDREVEAAIRALTAGGCRKLAVDLGGVTHIDTMCLGLFIAAQVSSQRRGGGVVLVRTPPRIRVLLRIAKLESFLPSVESEAEALEALAAGAAAG